MAAFEFVGTEQTCRRVMRAIKEAFPTAKAAMRLEDGHATLRIEGSDEAIRAARDAAKAAQS